MADQKISALPAATTPLAGTEVLPIVQSSTTKKVASDDLTVKNIRSNATTGILQIAGPGAATTRVMTVPNANFTAARTDAANSFTGDQTLSTGNLIMGTAGKGIDFSATANSAGMTSELFSDYEEGTWTPEFITTGGSFTYSQQFGRYTKIGRMVYVNFWMGTSSATVGTGEVRVYGLPFAINSNFQFRGGMGAIGRAENFVTQAPTAVFWVENQTFFYLTYISGSTTTDLAPANLNTGAGNNLYGAFCYTTN